MSLQSKLSHRRSDCRGDMSPLFSSLTVRVATATTAGGYQSILGNSGYGQFMIDCNPGITFLIFRRGYLPYKPCTLIYTAQGAKCSTSTTLYASYFPSFSLPIIKSHLLIGVDWYLPGLLSLFYRCMPYAPRISKINQLK